VTAQQYERVFAWFRRRPAALRALKAAKAAGTAGVYLVYGAALVFGWRRGAFWRTVCVPAAVFLSGTALRAGLNRPRPYEALGFAPLLPKHTRGKSMPSRHCFSAAAVAAAAWSVCPPLGAVGWALAAANAVFRVVSGVHYPSDVLAGLGYGAGVSWAGYTIWNFLIG